MKDPGICGRTILKWVFKRWVVGMEWIDLAKKVICLFNYNCNYSFCEKIEGITFMSFLVVIH